MLEQIFAAESILATGVAIWAFYRADKWKSKHRSAADLGLMYLSEAERLNRIVGTYRNLLDRKERRARNTPQPRDKNGRFA